MNNQVILIQLNTNGSHGSKSIRFDENPHFCKNGVKTHTHTHTHTHIYIYILSKKVNNIFWESY